MMRIGHGFDVHQLVPERPLVLGGVTIDYPLGLLGHSDADVLLHAICDGLLGALGEGDLGHHFPDSDTAYAGSNSRELLRQVVRLMHQRDYRLANLDATLICQQPRLAPYLQSMAKRIAADCRSSSDQVNIKATTTEKLGFTGRGEGIAAHAVVLLQRNESRIAAKRAALLS